MNLEKLTRFHLAEFPTPIHHLKSALHHSLEGEKGQGENAGGDQGDGGVLERTGHPGQDDPLAHAGKENQRQAETDGVGEGGDQGLQEGVLFVDVDQARAHDRAICGDQGQEYAQTCVERRNAFSQKHFHELDQGCDDENKGNGSEVFEAELHQHERVGHPGDHAGHHQNEHDRHGHADRRFHFLGGSEKRTVPQILRQQNIVDQNTTDGKNDIVAH